jgi:hypothetical protein
MKQLFLFAALAGTFAVTGCGGKKTDATDQSAPAGMMALDLSKYGKNVIINVPDSTTGPLTVEDMGGAIRISVGKAFQIQVKEGEGNLEMKKSEDIKKNEVYKFDKFSVEEPNAIIYAWHMEGGQPEFRMFSTVKVGEVTYEVEDVAGEVFSEAACQKMLESAKSLHAAEVKKPGA